MINSVSNNLSSLEEALFAAASRGDSASIRALVMDGVDLEARDTLGRNALNIASQAGHHDVMKTILAARQMAFLIKNGYAPLADENAGKPQRKSA